MSANNSTRYLKTNVSLSVQQSENSLLVTANGCETFKLDGEWENLLACLAISDGTLTYQEVLNELTKLTNDPDDAIEIIKFCLSMNLLTVEHKNDLYDAALTAHSLEKYDRQIKSFSSLPGQTIESAHLMHSRLENSHIAIVGVGGVGTYLALSAAMIGIKNITLIDHDYIELSNTSRQVLFTEKDLGRLKVDVAREKINHQFPDANLFTSNTEITNAKVAKNCLANATAELGKPTLLFLAADTPRGLIQYIFDDACAELGIPWTNLGPHSFSKISLGPLIVPGVTKKYSEYIPQGTIKNRHPLIEIVNSRFESNITDSYNGLAAKAGMVEALKFLTGYQTPTIIDSVIELDTANWSCEVLEIA